jgi:hypothetical protein
VETQVTIGYRRVELAIYHDFEFDSAEARFVAVVFPGFSIPNVVVRLFVFHVVRDDAAERIVLEQVEIHVNAVIRGCLVHGAPCNVDVPAAPAHADVDTSLRVVVLRAVDVEAVVRRCHGRHRNWNRSGGEWSGE